MEAKLIIPVIDTESGNFDTDIKLTADKLSVKGLLAALGQGAILKENNDFVLTQEQ